MMENKLLVGIAHGDVNSVSYELIIKLMLENKLCEVCTPVLFGSSKAAAYHRKALNIEGFALNSIQHPEDANAKRCNVINVTDDAVKVDLGRETRDSDEAAMLALRAALDCLDAGRIDVLAAAPQGCASFQEVGGWVNFLSKRYDRHVMPLYVGEKLKLGFLTAGIPFREIMGCITADAVYDRLALLDSTLKMDFTIRRSRIAVLGLNPYAGDGGYCGEEEKAILAPALEKARNAGIMALGPFSPEALFTSDVFEKFDVVLALYHGQGSALFRALEGYGGAVLFAGLPAVITTTAHGTAYDVVGKGVADDSGLRKAVYTAIDVLRNRKMNAELKANPLKHYNVAANSNETDMNVDQIAGVEKEKEE